MIFYKKTGRDFATITGKQFFGTSHIESEESDKNLHWKPVLPQPFSKEKIAVSGVGESVGEQSCGDACLLIY